MDSAHFVFDGEAERIGYLPGGLGYALAALVAVTFGAGTAAAQHGEEADNMRLVGHNDLQARSAYQPIVQSRAIGGSPMSAIMTARRSIL